MPTTFQPPVLSGDYTQLVPADLFKRSWSSKRRFSRFCLNESLRLKVELTQLQPQAQMKVVTNLNRENTQDWYEIDLEQTAKGIFETSIPLTQRGLFQFRVRYSPDGGKTWWWDRVPYSKVMVEPAQVTEVKMYSLIPTASGAIDNWITLLPGIADMGFNMVHLLPLTWMDVSRSPYSAHALFELDASYLNPNDSRDGLAQFEDFVQAAEQLGIGICVDLVLNHVGIGSQIIHRRPEWIMADLDEHDGFKRAGWEGHGLWHKWGDLALLNYGHPDEKIRRELWDYMLQYASFWASFAHRTKGMIRLDNLHSTHDGFCRHVLTELAKTYPDMLIFAELFASQEVIDRLTLSSGLNLLLGTQWEHHFVPELRRYLAWIHGEGSRNRFFLPISTHDSGTPAEEFGDVKSTIPRYAISCFYGHGMTGMAQGVEYGNRHKIDFIDRTEPIELSQDVDYRKTIRAFHDMIDGHSLFKTSGNLRFVDDDHNAILGAWRRDPSEEAPGFLLLTNLDIFNPQTLTIDLARYRLPDGPWENVLGGEGLKRREGNKLIVTLPPCGVGIFRNLQA